MPWNDTKSMFHYVWNIIRPLIKTKVQFHPKLHWIYIFYNVKIKSILTASPLSPCFPVGPTGPGEPGPPGTPGAPKGPVSPRSPLNVRRESEVSFWVYYMPHFANTYFNIRFLKDLRRKILWTYNSGPCLKFLGLHCYILMFLNVKRLSGCFKSISLTLASDTLEVFENSYPVDFPLTCIWPGPSGVFILFGSYSNAKFVLYEEKKQTWALTVAKLDKYVNKYKGNNLAANVGTYFFSSLAKFSNSGSLLW